MVHAQLSTFAVAAFCLYSTVLAHGGDGAGHVNRNARHLRYLARRQNTPTPTATDVPPLSAITSGMPTESPTPLFTSFAPGATPPISGAPPLPSTSIVVANYPALDIVPPTDSPQLQTWMDAMNAANIPNNPQTKDGSCASDPELVPNAGPNGTCWWTCGGCMRETDVSTCPTKNVWGVSYDDGPSDYTPKLINYLNEQQLKATFFAVGSRVISRPAILQAEYLLGHQISVHTWSHPPLTSLTNEQIVAELGWTMIAMKDVLGVTPNTFRPPYGDIDDRVRAIAKSMGLTPILWTGYGANEFDTDDWRIPGGTANGTSSYAAFNHILDLASQLTTGFIVLEHDLYQATVMMAMDYFLPLAKQRSFTLKSIYDCLGETLASTYKETSNSTSTNTITTGGSHSSTSASGSKTSSTQLPNAGQGSPSPGAASARVSLGFSGGALIGGACSLAMIVCGAAALL